jgi:hypothetical protein
MEYFYSKDGCKIGLPYPIKLDCCSKPERELVDEAVRITYENYYLQRWILESVNTKTPIDFKEI